MNGKFLTSKNLKASVGIVMVNGVSKKRGCYERVKIHFKWMDIDITSLTFLIMSFVFGFRKVYKDNED